MYTAVCNFFRGVLHSWRYQPVWYSLLCVNFEHEMIHYSVYTLLYTAFHIFTTYLPFFLNSAFGLILYRSFQICRHLGEVDSSTNHLVYIRSLARFSILFHSVIRQLYNIWLTIINSHRVCALEVCIPIMTLIIIL